MATATRQRRRAPARRRKSVTAPARAALTRGREAAGRQLGGYGADAAGIALIALGILFVLGMTSDLAGAVGRGLESGSAAGLGRARVLAPIACFVAAGLLLWRSREGEGRDGRPVVVAPMRVGLGIVLVVVAIAGLLHLGADRPAVGEGVRQAGGIAGLAVAQPLAAGAGVVGAAVVLVALGVLGALLAPGIPLWRVGTLAAAGTRHLGRGVDSIFTLAPRPRGPSTDEDDEALAAEVVELDDDLDEPEPEVRAVVQEVLEEPVAATPGPPAGTPGEQLAIDLGEHTRPGSWKLPPGSMLKRGNGPKIDPRIVDDRGRVLEATLCEFGVDARVVGATVGPTVTRYEVELGAGVKVNKVTTLSHDIAYAMASPDVRILAPIPGKSAIGVEVPNQQRQLVTLGDILATPEARDASHPLEAGLGRDIAGRAVMLDLAAMPHLLIAGATGAGKSSCINSLITSVIMRSTPDEVRLILVDPKRVELGGYESLPHLLTGVVTNPKRAASALDWAVREMDMRYELLAEVGVRDITGYNAAFDGGELATKDEPDPVTGKGYERLPYILIVVDELNDLMMVAARDVEASICRIAQMARAVGIHLVIATQRPSVDVITGVIKANIPSRLAFSVTSIADSRVILDQSGAEKLIGLGDMLLVTASSSRPQRIQGAWVDETCIRKVAAHWKRQAGPDYVDGLVEEAAGGAGAAGEVDDDDDLLEEALDLVVRSQLGSTSMLQRKLRVGFARAGRLMDLLERRGVVGPSEGSKARAVLMTVEELEETQTRTA
jgi:DNA segregation ATPase FtsK/SpoIIIE, S-DNA-T family